MATKLWTEIYRPTDLNGYVFADSTQREIITSWINSKSIPNLLFSGSAGVGKTTLARILINALDIDPYDVLEINASRENSVDTIRDKISGFVETMPFGTFKVVLLDEADFITPNGQAALRNLMESYHQTARFILTCVTGDTKVFTPFGFKRIDKTNVNDEILGLKSTSLINRALVRSRSDDVYHIITRHGFNIKATGNHKFWNFSGDISASELKKGDKIAINIDKIVGNNFEHDTTPFIVDHDDVREFLRKRQIFSEEQLTFLRENSNLWFYNNHKVIYDYLTQNNITSSTVTDLCRELKFTGSIVRGFLTNVSKYVVKTKWKHTFDLDIVSLKRDVEMFNQELSRRNIVLSHTHKNRFILNQISQEDILRMIPEEFTDDEILSIGRLVGFFEGDGHISTIVHCAANNLETLEKVELDIRKFVDVTAVTKQNSPHSNGYQKAYQSLELKLILEYFGATVGNKSKTIRRVTHWANHKLFFKGFIQALYDSDGKKFVVKDTTISPIHLTQSIYDESQIVFVEDIRDLLLKHFNIDSYVTIKKYDSSVRDTFKGGSGLTMELLSCKREDISKYLGCIGHYYDKVNRPELWGYSKYKENSSGYKFLRFDGWVNDYYGFGFINDDIISVNKIEGGFDVYDCSFDEHHWYVTDGFVSHNCNYPHKVIPALHSRCQGFHVDKVDLTEFTARAATILVEEGVEFDLDTLDTYVRATYPDLRKCLNTLQMNSTTGRLIAAATGTDGGQEWKIRAVELFKAGKPTEARKLMCASIRSDEMDEVFTWLYQNLELWGPDQDTQDEAIKIIKRGMVDIPFSADTEITLAATMVELAQLTR